jgi:DNA-binding HxlR family transcriptional regulator
MMTAQVAKTGGEQMNELEILQQAGLTVYQSKVYAALKSESGLRPVEIVHKSGIPQSKLHETLHALEKLGLVRRHLDKQLPAEIDRRITEFISELRDNRVGIKIYGRGRVRAVWSTNGVSLTSLVDKKIQQLEAVKRRIAKYEAPTAS